MVLSPRPCSRSPRSPRRLRSLRRSPSIHDQGHLTNESVTHVPSTTSCAPSRPLWAIWDMLNTVQGSPPICSINTYPSGSSVQLTGTLQALRVPLLFPVVYFLRLPLLIQKLSGSSRHQVILYLLTKGCLLRLQICLLGTLRLLPSPFRSRQTIP